MRLRKLAVIGAASAALLVPAGLGLSGTAQAAGSTEICNSITGGHCINAWGGGPQVNAYTDGVTNDNFKIVAGTNNHVEIEDMNTGTYVGDYGNTSGDARAGLVPFNGWGANFIREGCEGITGGYIFVNTHWTNGILYAPDSNGAAFYLNTNNDWCSIQRNF